MINETNFSFSQCTGNGNIFKPASLSMRSRKLTNYLNEIQKNVLTKDLHEHYQCQGQ